MYGFGENATVEGFNLEPLREYRPWKAFSWVYGTSMRAALTHPIEALHFDFRKPVNESGQHVRIIAFSHSLILSF
jgi:hypothetical protein